MLPSSAITQNAFSRRSYDVNSFCKYFHQEFQIADSEAHTYGGLLLHKLGTASFLKLLHLHRQAGDSCLAILSTTDHRHHGAEKDTQT